MALPDFRPLGGDAGGHPSQEGKTVGRFRWLICSLLFVVTVNNYLDRQMFSVAAPVIASEFRLTNSDIAAIANAFLAAYTFGQLLAGMFVDWIGARNGLTLAVAAWTVTATLTSWARGIVSFGSLRCLLGLSESLNYPAGVKVSAEWFPPKELATAVGIFQSGSSMGALVAPPLVAFLIVHFGWRAAFLAVALPGLLWIPIWRTYYRPLAVNPRVSDAERAYIVAGRDERTQVVHSKIRWRTLLRRRVIWGVALARFFEEPAGWFYFTWLPLYLKQDRSLSLLSSGFLLTIPFLTFDVGKIGGGWLSSLLLKSGWPLDRSRKAVMLMSAVCLMASIPAVLAHSALAFILLIGIATFGHGCWTTTAQTIPGDIIAPALVGSVYGITAFGGGIGSILFMYATGKLVDTQKSFTLPFVIAGVLPIIGYGLFVLVAGEIRHEGDTDIGICLFPDARSSTLGE